MNITFLIGNGFDINLDLKTRYTDFYEYFIPRAQEDKLKQSLKKDYSLWADLEIALGVKTNLFKDQEEDEFFDCKERIEKHLIDYLSMENSKVVYKDKKMIASCFQKNVVNFYQEFAQRDSDFYKTLEVNDKVIHYNFVSFNYTDVLDNIVKICIDNLNPFSSHIFNGTKKNDEIHMPVHVHGTLTQGLVLGVNDVSQIENASIKKKPRLSNYLIKTSINENSGYYKVRETKQLIDNSDYVCLFGLSIGDTDNYWWQVIIQWLINNGNKRLVLYVKDDSVVAPSASARNRFDDQQRDIFFQHRGKIDQEKIDQIYNQVIVVQNSKIFDIEGIEISSAMEESNNEREIDYLFV